MSAHDQIEKRLKKTEQKIKEFSELLDTISSMDDKRKSLWKEVYNNALADRENAYALYISAYSTFMGGQGEHINLGPIMVKYLERMSKANEQILKLAEIVKSSQEEATAINAYDLFSKIQND
jgi:hypothetical protein